MSALSMKRRSGIQFPVIQQINVVKKLMPCNEMNASSGVS